jgi:hypothetical protein
MQALQPLQAALSTSGSGATPMRGRNGIALTSHISPHAAIDVLRRQAAFADGNAEDQGCAA